MFEPTRISDYTPTLTKPLVSKTLLDQLISTKKGLFPSTKTLISGDPGIGKTTILLWYLAELSKQNIKTLFISAEMGKSGIYKYSTRFPQFKNIDMMFTDEYKGVEFEVLDVMLESGDYDVVLLDSWAQLLHLTPQIKEDELLELFNYYSDNYETSFLFIQQVTKDKKLAGKNYLKHMVDNVIKIKADPKFSEVKYIEYEKNRDGDVDKKLYFDISTNDIKFSFDKPTIPLTPGELLKMVPTVKRMKKRDGLLNHLTVMNELNIDVVSAWELCKIIEPLKLA